MLISDRPCQILSVSQIKIKCETSLFPRSMLYQNQTISILFDHRTILIYKHSFTIVSNPVLYVFDKNDQYKSFMSGGHEIIILGENFHIVQNIQLEFKNFIFTSPLFRNKTLLKFLTPSIQELHLNHQQIIEITICLDNFKKTSSLIYMNDPIIYELEPRLQTYTDELVIRGANFTAIGHTRNQVLVYIGCDLCIVIHLDTNNIICQPPLYRPEKYSETERLCYKSEHPPIIVSIDNIQSHIGFMIYPKRLIMLGKEDFVLESSAISQSIDITCFHSGKIHQYCKRIVVKKIDCHRDIFS